MFHEDRFHLIQERAYEIYRHRDPSSGTPEDDWREAEAEIAAQEGQQSMHIGPARLLDKAHWGAIGTHAGEDLENPA